MDAYFIIGTVILLLIIIYISSLIAERKRKAWLKQTIDEAYGKFSEIEYTKDDLIRISKYHLKKVSENKDKYYIDDITWNDLGMDDIFAKINITGSSIGEEYLYHRLHECEIEDTDSARFKYLVDYFTNDDENRLKLQLILYNIGKIKRFSVTDILEYANDLKREKNFKHYILDILLLISIGLIFVSPAIGVLLFIILLCVSVFSYFKIKNEIAPYFMTFMYIIKLVKAAKEIINLKDEKLKKENEELVALAKEFNVFCRNSYFFSQGVKLTENIFELIFDYIRMIFHVDIIKFNTMLNYLQSHYERIDELRSCIGRFDAAISVSSMKKSFKYYCEPEFIVEKSLKIKDAFHPLLKDPVSNSIYAKRGVLITGSNASGKSTFIKSVAICAIMAQSLGIVPASEYKCSKFRIASSMALSDNIKGNESYFIVEIKSLKRIMDISKQEGYPVLCFIDEVLRGTNTIERIAASSEILKELNNENVICFAATHDIELTSILKDSYDNYHFDEEIIDNDVVFNYVLKDGIATTRNAIKLLFVIGYDESVIKSAENRAQNFIDSNVWS